MAGAIHNAGQEFWQSPLAQSVTAQESGRLVEVCQRCGSEFVVGAGFCHVCGTSREVRPGNSSFAKYADLQRVKDTLGLGTASLVAFIVGLGCVLGAILTPLLYSVATVLDWQAIQAWRAEWLLGSIAAFVAGILLKQAS